MLPGNLHNQGFCAELQGLNLWANQISDEGIKLVTTALTHTNCLITD